MVAFSSLKYLWNIVCNIVWNNFYGIFLTFYLYFRHIPIMFSKKSARDGGKAKRTITRATLRVKKKIIAEHENRVKKR